MSVSNYIQEKKYLIKDLDNYIYLFPFNEPILNYITDDGTLNATASNINGNGYEVYCENVSYNSNSNINSRFSFEHTLTLSIFDISTSLINLLVRNKWMVLFKNKSGDMFVLNAEYPIDVTYQYNINDENTPNSLTITLKSLSNTPIINYNENLKYTTLREKPCGYNHSMIKRLRMLETTKGFISTSDNKIDVYMYHDTLKIIDVNPSSLSFTDSFNGDTYEQTLSFEIPLINYQFYFHYNILEYINNRYYCIIETTDGKYIVGGYKSGMFPSYAIEGNNIKITLTTNATSNNTLISDYISFNEIEYNHCVGIDGECIDGLWTYKLIQRLELDGSVSDEYYALNGYENDYTDINIVGTYGRFDTTFGIKLTNPLYDCFKKCYISGLPSSLIFKNTGETQCFTIESDCDFTYSYDITIIDVTFNEDTNELCVKSLKMDSSTQIKITTSDGIDRFVNVVIGIVGGEEGEYERQYRWFYNGETYCLDENQQINCESAKTTTDTITSGVCTYYKTELYISPLCDGNYDFYGYGLGDLISCERIYRWVVSDDETDYYCDTKTHTKYAIEYEEYSDDNGLTWMRTYNTRATDIVIEEKSEDCGYGELFDWVDYGNEICVEDSYVYEYNELNAYNIKYIDSYDNHAYYVKYSPYNDFIPSIIDVNLNNFTTDEIKFNVNINNYDSISLTIAPCNLGFNRINKNGVCLFRFVCGYEGNASDYYYIVSYNIHSKQFITVAYAYDVNVSNDGEYFGFGISNSDTDFILYKGVEGYGSFTTSYLYKTDGKELNLIGQLNDPYIDINYYNKELVLNYTTKSFGEYKYNSDEVYLNKNKEYDFLSFDYKNNIICSNSDGLYVITKNETIYIGSYAFKTITENSIIAISTKDASNTSDCTGFQVVNENLYEITYSDASDVSIKLLQEDFVLNGRNIVYNNNCLYSCFYSNNPRFGFEKYDESSFIRINDTYCTFIATKGIIIKPIDVVLNTSMVTYDLNTNTYKLFCLSNNWVKDGNYVYNISVDGIDTKITKMLDVDLYNQPYLTLIYSDDVANPYQLYDNHATYTNNYLIYKEHCTNTIRVYKDPFYINYYETYYFLEGGFETIIIPNISNITFIVGNYTSYFENCKYIVFSNSTPPKETDFSDTKWNKLNITVIIPKDASILQFKNTLNIPSNWKIINEN